MRFLLKDAYLGLIYRKLSSY